MNLETILLADDEASVRRFVSRILKTHGYHVLEAGDGEEALAASEGFQGIIHLLLTDVMMPVMNGKELADRLCVLRPDIKVLFISAYPSRDIYPEETCEGEADVDLLPKPFTAFELMAKVRGILDAPVQEK